MFEDKVKIVKRINSTGNTKIVDFMEKADYISDSFFNGAGNTIVATKGNKCLTAHVKNGLITNFKITNII